MEPGAEHSDSDDELFEELKTIPLEMKNASQTDRLKIILDKYRGVIWGCAIADGFEGCRVKTRGIKFPTSSEGMIREDWTESKSGRLHRLSDHMVLLMDSSYFDESNIMRVDNKLFASKLVTWRYNGFAELGDTISDNIDSLTAKLTAHPRYTLEPQIVALEVYKSLGGDTNSGKIDAPAPNGALMRIAPLALSEDYLDEILEHCIATHYDGRCVFTCIMQCDIIRHIIKHNNNITTNMINQMYESASGILDTNFANEVKEYFNLGMTTSVAHDNKSDIFEKLEVGQYGGNLASMKQNCDKKSYTLVAFAIMLWALRAAMAKHSYSSIIKTIISAGDDAAIAGAVVGAWFGYSNLPSDWINSTPHKDWLDKKINDFLNRTK